MSQRRGRGEGEQLVDGADYKKNSQRNEGHAYNTSRINIRNWSASMARHVYVSRCRHRALHLTGGCTSSEGHHF